MEPTATQFWVETPRRCQTFTHREFCVLVALLVTILPCYVSCPALSVRDFFVADITDPTHS